MFSPVFGVHRYVPPLGTIVSPVYMLTSLTAILVRRKCWKYEGYLARRCAVGFFADFRSEYSVDQGSD